MRLAVRHVFASLVVCVGFALGATAARAQEPLDLAYTTLEVGDWEPDRVTAFQTDPRFRTAVRERFSDAREASRWLSIFEMLAAEYGAVPRATAPADLHAQQRFQAELDGLVAAFREAYATADLDGEPDTKVEVARVLRVVNRQGFGGQNFRVQEKRRPDAHADWTDRAGLFLYAATPVELATEILFTDYAAEAARAGEQVPRLSLDVLVDMRLRADTLATLLDEFGRDLTLDQIGQLARAKEHWDRYLDEGYSQYPWEEMLNGFSVDERSLEPPRWQWIALHPAIGVEVDPSSFDELRVSEALSVEILGRIRYDRDFKDFRGGSLALVLRDDIGPGFGAIFHWNRTLNFGVAWHDVDDDNDWFDDSPQIFCTLDLFRLVESRAKRLHGVADRVLQ